MASVVQSTFDVPDALHMEARPAPTVILTSGSAPGAAALYASALVSICSLNAFLLTLRAMPPNSSFVKAPPNSLAFFTASPLEISAGTP